ncbi:hypothetical protein [Breoghania sp.]|uniref:hypothetical protein n=1 Tax=Breoghania sp. TaxID=2065378 RepID=UPI002AAB8348|nr:hypothetical protein [Breoghania sp.]
MPQKRRAPYLSAQRKKPNSTGSCERGEMRLEKAVSAGALALAFFLAVAGKPVSADPLGLNDYAALFDKYPDRITPGLKNDTTLTLPDGVKIVRREDNYVGFDPKGGVGCLVAGFIEIDALSRHCPQLMDKDQTARFAAQRTRLLGFYAQNAYPPVSAERARGVYEAVIAGRMNNKTSCATPMLDNARMFLPGLLDQRELEKKLSVPRLPVRHPCL